MTTVNLPLELLIKHRESLGLKDSFVFDTDNSLFEAVGQKKESAVVFLPKSRPLIDMTLALVSGMVVENGLIALVGANDAGIGSAKKSYEANVGPVDQKVVGSHSALYIGKNRCLGAGKKTEDFLSFSPLSYKDSVLEIANVPGVFSNGVLDEGTKLLLDHIPYDRKTVLDVGCGAGIIGAIYKAKNSLSEITSADSSKLAILATQKTFEKNGFTSKIILSDVFSNVEGTFDLIVTNPPFHKGISTDYSFIESFARNAHKHLNKGGQVFVVANSFLPYQQKLEASIGPTEVVIDTKKFRVYKSIARG